MTGASLVLSCPACLQRNRVPRQRLGDVPVCSSCKTRLLPDHPVALAGSSFDAYVNGSELPVLVDFWAPWCGPCKVMAPHFAAAARALVGRVLLAKVDTEAEPGVAARFAIQSIPTVVLFVGGREQARQSGAMTASQIESWVGPQLG